MKTIPLPKSVEPIEPPPTKLLDRVRDRIRRLGYSRRTELSYVSWIKHFIVFHDKRHPAEMGKAEIEAFLTHLATARNVAASTQNLALSSIQFLYREVLELPLPWLSDVVRAKKPARLTTMLNRQEAREWLGHSDVSTAMIDTHVLNKGGRGVTSPLDA